MQLSRKQVRSYRVAQRKGDPDAALALLAHSVALGHSRLCVQRFLAVRALATPGAERFAKRCAEAANQIAPSELLAMAERVVQRVSRHSKINVSPSELVQTCFEAGDSAKATDDFSGSDLPKCTTILPRNSNWKRVCL